MKRMKLRLKMLILRRDADEGGEYDDYNDEYDKDNEDDDGAKGREDMMRVMTTMLMRMQV